MPVDLQHPVFLVGHARAGSTVLAAILNLHPDIGPKPSSHAGNARDIVSRLLEYHASFAYAEQLEQKNIWFRHCGGADLFTHMGKELARDETFTPKVDRDRLVAELTADFGQKRFLSKAPTNTFRIRLLAALFPDAKFIVLYRQGEEVVASWGRRPYGFGKPVDWGDVHLRKLSHFRGINTFSRKWRETIEVAESSRGSAPMLRITYRQLTSRTQITLDAVSAFLGLEPPLSCPARLEDSRKDAWREVVPARWRLYLRLLCRSGNRVLARVEQEFDSMIKTGSIFL